MSIVGLEDAEKIALNLQKKVNQALIKQQKFIRQEIDKIELLLNDKETLRNWKNSIADNSRIAQLFNELDEVERLYINAGNTEAGEIFKARMTRELSQRLTNLKANQKEVEILAQKFKAQTQAETLSTLTKIQREGSVREMYQQSRQAGGFLSNLGKAYMQDVVTMESNSAGSETLGGYINKLYNKYENDLKDVLVQGIVRGDSYKKMVDNLRQKTKITVRNANKLIRTESNAIFNNSVKRVIQDNPLVKGYRFRAVLDSRTSSICQNHDGEFIPKDNLIVGVNYPPLHPNCRSTVTTVLYNENEMKDTMQRYTKNGSNEWVPVPKGMTYLEFKDKYGFNTSRTARRYQAQQREINGISISKITSDQYKGYVKPSVNATKEINKMIEAYQNNDTLYLDAIKKNTGYDQINKALYRQAQADSGFDGLPLQLNSNTFTDEVLKYNYRVVYRKFGHKEDLEEFLNGEQPFTIDSDNIGITTFDEISTENTTNTLTMAIRSGDTKMLDASKFQNIIVTDDARINDILSAISENRDITTILGLSAIEYGYDVIRMRDENNQIRYFILNRTSLIIKGD